MHRITLFLVLALVAATVQAQTKDAAKTQPQAAQKRPSEAAKPPADVPQRKSGLWEVTRTTVRTEGEPKVMQYCIDQKSDNALRQLAEGMRNESCTIDKKSREGDKLVVDGVCKLGFTGSTAKTHAVITGNFDTAYKIESKSIFDPPVRGKTEGNGVLSARWLGPCKPDQKPGDVVLETGSKLRVNEDVNVGKQKHDHDKKDGATPYTQPSSPASTK